MKKLNKSLFFTYTFIYIIAISIGLYFRLYPLRQYTPEKISERAAIFVLSQLKTKVSRQVNHTNPNLTPEEKETLIQKQLNLLLRQQKNDFHKTIQRVAKDMTKSEPQQSSNPYLLASDSFYYYNLTENIKNTGKISDTVKGSKYLHKLMLAPVGHLEPFNLHPYVGYFIYKILKIFNPNINLMYAVSYTPLIITALSLIPFLFICALSKFHPAVSLTSSLFFLLSPIFIKRSTFGWYDNDPYNTLFPLIILSLFFYGLKYSFKKNTKTRFLEGPIKTYFIAGITALSMMLYAFFWQGWMLVFSVLFISILFILLENHFLEKNKANIKTFLIYFGIILGGSFITISCTFGPQEFFTLFAEGWHALKNFLAPQLSPWPDLYISVSELHSASLPFIITLTGGKTFFIIAILGIFFSFIHQRKICITLTIFLAISLIITQGAQRFAMLCLIPLSLLFPFGLQCIYDSLKKILSKFSQSNILIPIFILLFSILPVRFIHIALPSLLNPLFNQTWEKTLINIDKNTPKDSIINTWWPPGHFIKAIAHRRVTFDGASINYPQAYWISNFFLSQTENEGIGILRMLNNSANQAAEYLHEKLGLPLSTSILILKEITQYDKTTARILLNKFISQKEYIEHILKLTHASPPPSYCLIYKEFIENNLQLKFIGGWNFKEIEEINKNPERMAAVPKRNSREYIDFLWNLAGGPYKYSGPLDKINRNKNMLLFKNNITVDLTKMDCKIDSPKYGRGTPTSLFYLKNDTIIEKKLPNATLPYSVILYQKNNTYHTVLADQPLANSLLMKLYYFGGKGLRHFKLFSDESDLTKRTEILVFEVDWVSFNKIP